MRATLRHVEPEFAALLAGLVLYFSAFIAEIVRSGIIAIAIGYPDLVAVVNVTITQTGQATENVLIIVAYLAVSLSTSIFMNWYNRQLVPTER